MLGHFETNKNDGAIYSDAVQRKILKQELYLFIFILFPKSLEVQVQLPFS